MIALTLRIETAQTALIKALDAQDAEAIQAAVKDLAPLIDELQASGTLYANAEAKQSFEKLQQLTNAAAYRIRVLHDQTRIRLEMLHDQRGKTSETYSKPVKSVRKY